MNWTGKERDDGSVELTLTISPEEIASVKAAIKAQELGGELVESTQASDHALEAVVMRLNPFRRKARYCITCSHTGQQHDIRAYGDIHAGLIGAAMCGSFQMSSGRCKRSEEEFS